jgi:hypothetical protein
MSHKYTDKEIDNAKIQILQAKLGGNFIKADALYDQAIADLHDLAIAFLDGSPAGHSYDGDPNAAEDDRPQVQELDD